LAAEAHLAGGQFLLEGQTLNVENSLIYRAGTRRKLVPHPKMRRFIAKINSNKEQCIELVPPLRYDDDDDDDDDDNLFLII
jgi:hypothetical protein